MGLRILRCAMLKRLRASPCMPRISAAEQCKDCADLIAYRATQLTPDEIRVSAAASASTAQGVDSAEVSQRAIAVACMRRNSSTSAALVVSAQLTLRDANNVKPEPHVLEPLDTWLQGVQSCDSPEGDAPGDTTSDSAVQALADNCDKFGHAIEVEHTINQQSRGSMLAGTTALREANNPVAGLASALQASAARTGDPIRDLVVVLPALLGASRYVRDLLQAITGVAPPCTGVVDARASLAHVHLAPDGTGTLVEPPQPPFRYTGSQDWFTAHVPTWQRLLCPFRDALAARGAPMRALELGCWEGRSSVWLLQNMLTSSCGTDKGTGVSDAASARKPVAGSRLVCVDHFDLLRTDAGRARRGALARNLALTGLGHICEVYEEFTVPALAQLLREGAQFDFVYIDASHTRSDVLMDATLAWRCVTEGGWVIFDDYAWPNHARDSAQHPAEGIDAFCWAHRDELEIVHVEYQLAVKRTAPACRGFEWRDAPEVALAEVAAEGGAMWRGRM